MSLLSSVLKAVARVELLVDNVAGGKTSFCLQWQVGEGKSHTWFLGVVCCDSFTLMLC